MTEPTLADYQRVADELNLMSVMAESLDTKRCVEGEPMLWLPYHRAVVPGHIYSEKGIDEARMSGCCEYHFDRMFEPGWVDVITGEKGDMPDEDD